MLVIAAQFALPHEAHMARAKLAAEGINAFVTNEHSINLLNAFGQVELMVDSTLAEQAKTILARDDSQLLDELE